MKFLLDECDADPNAISAPTQGECPLFRIVPWEPLWPSEIDSVAQWVKDQSVKKLSNSTAALHLAAGCGSVNACKLLLARGAKIELPDRFATL